MRRMAATGRDASDRSAAGMRLLWPALCRWARNAGGIGTRCRRGASLHLGRWARLRRRGLARQRPLTDRVWAAQQLDKRRGREARQAMALMNARWGGTCSSVEDGAMAATLEASWVCFHWAMGWRLCRAMCLPLGLCGGVLAHAFQLRLEPTGWQTRRWLRGEPVVLCRTLQARAACRGSAEPGLSHAKNGGESVQCPPWPTGHQTSSCGDISVGGSVHGGVPSARLPCCHAACRLQRRHGQRG